MDFVHLHVHTKYSIRDGIIRIEDLVDKCKKDGMTACAITDHGAMYGVIDFYNSMKSAGIKPIIGYESYTAPNSNHLILLAKNNQGYKNLMKLCSQENIEGLVKAGRFAKGNLDLNWVKDNNLGEGIIALTACLGGTTCKEILAGNIANAVAYVQNLTTIFDEVYIELQDNSTKEQVLCNLSLMDIARQLNLKIVITKDAHYLNQEDWEAHDSMLAIQVNKNIDDPKRWRFPGGHDYYIATKDEMAKSCNNLKIPYEAMTNTVEIANKCNVYLFDEKDDNGNIIHHGVYSGSLFPDYPFVPEGYTQDTYLAKIAFEGLTKFILTRPSSYKMNVKKYIDRLNYELDIISSMGYSGYFLILWDFLKYCREYRDPSHPSGIGLGTGRGCFTEDALIHTKETLKSIKDAQIGDEVISKDGCFHKVIDTMYYDIEEEMIQIKHLYEIDKHPSICTKDHKILVNRNNELQWAEAQNVLKSDYVCIPKAINNGDIDKQDLKYDEHYYYLPIKEIVLLPKQKVRVYDLTVENQHNYLLNNMIVHNSGVGSLVCRSCNITKIDPIKYMLLFERFLNPERESEPDVDKYLMIA